MKKILQLFRNARDFILVFVVLCIAHFEGEEDILASDSEPNP